MGFQPFSAARSPTLDHVGLAVWNLKRAVELLVDGLGGIFVTGGDSIDYGMRTVHVEFNGFCKVELMSPTEPDAALVAHLEAHGEGVHHLTFMVDDLDYTIGRVEDASFPCTSTDRSKDVWHEAYVRPEATFGVLLQLVRVPEGFSRTADGMTLAAVLDGMWEWRNGLPVRRT